MVRLFLAILLTCLSVFYQRLTGPSYPAKVPLTVGGKTESVRLPRSHPTTSDCPIAVPLMSPDQEAAVYFRPYPSKGAWRNLPLGRKAHTDTQSVALPPAPPAGKIQYYLLIKAAGDLKLLGSPESPFTLRFHGDVPTVLLTLHILFMLFAMCASNLAGLDVLAKGNSYQKYAVLTVGFLIVGGFVLGPWVQKCAFGHLWTGFPIGNDVTDTKTLIALGAWIVAVLLNFKRKHPWAAFLAAVVLFAVFFIPHSVLGSQLDYQTGKVITG